MSGASWGAPADDGLQGGVSSGWAAACVCAARPAASLLHAIGCGGLGLMLGFRTAGSWAVAALSAGSPIISATDRSRSGLRSQAAGWAARYRRRWYLGRSRSPTLPSCSWGDRIGRIRDPMGNLWWIQARVEDVDEAEIDRRMSDPVWLERMAYVESVDPFAKDAE